MNFDMHIGIDYSGAKTPVSRLVGLQVYASTGREEAEKILSPASTSDRHRHWTRQQIAEFLIDVAKENTYFIAGIDHAFSFPAGYFEWHNLKSWNEFLDDFCEHWPTNQPDAIVASIRERALARSGSPDEFRLTEKWTASAKSVFWFGFAGSVATSTHAGIPWLRQIRREVNDRIHFWPFDGWAIPDGKSAIVEVYPALFKHRFPKEDRDSHQQDAYAVARWLAEMDHRESLDRYFHPPLTDEERKKAELEGWILGVA